MRIEKAQKEDIPRILQIIEEARSFQLSYGNKQWAHGYPSRALLSSDAEEGIGYFAVEDDIVGYLAIVDYDAAYDELEGKWLSAEPYIALHRIALSDKSRGKGFFPSLINETGKIARERGAWSIRIDTDRRNPIMLHLLPKLGFVFTGTVLFAGDKKLAYELLLD